MYEYKAYVVSVYDGDTIRVDIDLGFSVKLENVSIRLYGINTPEIRGDAKEAGIKARDFLRRQILDKEITIRTYKDRTGKYGRILGDIYLHGVNINTLLVVEGFAKPLEL